MSQILKKMEPNDSFYKNHVTFTSVCDIQDIVKTDLLRTGFDYFTFDRAYYDGSHLKLTSAGKWIEHYYRNKLYDVCLWDSAPELFDNSYLFWSWLKREPVYSQAKLFNIDNGLTIIKTHKNYCDFYNFGTSIDNVIPAQNIISNINLLHNFVAIFNEKARNLIFEAERNRFILPIKQEQDIQLENIKKIDVSNLGRVKHLYLGDEFDNCYLTGKELQIMQNLIAGKNMSNIAKELFISTRTVETHVSHVKDKLKCKTIFELGFISCKLGIDHLLYPQSIQEKRLLK